ncbi:8-amino-7-oxononanoate synthase [Flavobacteriales bacterium 33_180_T64]|nr:8-amino-7-oxononanoate synthase [Flavobacteriales bacterium 33_180_T64]
MLPKKLKQKLDIRKQNQSFRQLGNSKQHIDFSSNDYLGFAQSKVIFEQAHQYLITHNYIQNGATGSRLLSGNHQLYSEVEQQISKFHNSQSALIFNSGYDANLGFFSSVPQRGDIILYDEYCHASIRDGIAMSHAKAYKFEHNNLEELERLIHRYSELISESHHEIYVVTESIFSMDGDAPDLKGLSELCKNQHTHLIIDEAHAVGVFGENGNGLISDLQLENFVFARIITFGKALGSHGAAILCHQSLKDYLINFSRSFIYTTALPPHALATIKTSYNTISIQSDNETSPIQKLHHNITFFKAELKRLGLLHLFIPSHSAIQSCIIHGNENAKQTALKLEDHGFDVKAILSPTVSKGKERLRFCIHSYNSSEEITKVLQLLAIFV